ncbi:MAG: hypothetical protein MJ155_02455 [Candidatus Saccharibacteria bacterium]|nr:hypothetical protein [Candidatus Saccharibacteria bacterium]
MCKIDVMWIGLSAKCGRAGCELPPLDESSNSGKIISGIESRFSELSFYRTNLVKFAPQDNSGKLRYPYSSEMESAMPALLQEIQNYQPKVVFLLGRQVGEFVRGYFKKNNVATLATFHEVYHPSYVYIYKRRQLEQYIDDISKKIKESIS